MKWLKKWCYLILFLAAGLVYLTCVDNWQVYAEPLAQVKAWCRELDAGNIFMADGWAGAWSPGSAGETVSGDGGEAMPDSTDVLGDISGSGPEIPGEDGENGSGDFPAGETQPGLGTPGEETGSGSGPAAPGEGTGSGTGPGTPGEETGSGTGPGTPGEETGSGSGLAAPGEGTGSGSGPGTPGEETGSGSGPAAPGEETGSGSGPGASGAEGGGSPQGGTAPGEAVLPEVQYTAVEDDYFADALFIGDSRTVGMFEYGGLEETAAFYASTGLTVYKMFEAEIVSVPGERKKITVEEALQQNKFAKIYLMIGINEMGTGTVESFLEKYQEVVDRLRELQPDAVIYLQAIIKVTTERSGQGDYISNEGILARNEGIAKMADNEKVFFLDVNPLICDETGGMIPEYTFDGVHLKAKYIGIWKDYLKSHAIFS